MAEEKKKVNSKIPEGEKNWFRRHWILTSLVGIVLLFFIIGAFNSKNPSTQSSTNGHNNIQNSSPSPQTYYNSQYNNNSQNIQNNNSQNSLPSTNQVNTAPNLTIVSSQLTKGSNGQPQVNGVAKNTGGNKFTYVEIDAKIYSSTCGDPSCEYLIGTLSTNTSNLAAGAYWPFVMDASTFGNNAQYYSLSVGLNY